jgi:hypothetical protein
MNMQTFKLEKTIPIRKLGVLGFFCFETLLVQFTLDIELVAHFTLKVPCRTGISVNEIKFSILGDYSAVETAMFVEISKRHTLDQSASVGL